MMVIPDEDDSYKQRETKTEERSGKKYDYNLVQRGEGCLWELDSILSSLETAV